MAKFRKKPIVIEAVQIIHPVSIHTLEGTMNANPGDWMVTGIAGEKYPVKDSIFRATYESVD